MLKIFSIVKLTLAIVISAVFLEISAQSSEISIVINTGSSYTITQPEAKQIFNGQKVAWPNGKNIVIVDQGDSETGKIFYSEYFGHPVNKARVEWTKKVLSGQMSAPVKCSNDDAVKKEVANNPNSVGYILTNNLDKSVKEILRMKK